MGDIANWIIESEMEREVDSFLDGYDDDESEDNLSCYSKPSQLKPAGDGPCPKCGSKMHKVEGSRGVFWGCNNFPKCNGSRNWKV